MQAHTQWSPASIWYKRIRSPTGKEIQTAICKTFTIPKIEHLALTVVTRLGRPIVNALQKKAVMLSIYCLYLHRLRSWSKVQ